MKNDIQACEDILLPDIYHSVVDPEIFKKGCGCDPTKVVQFPPKKWIEDSKMANNDILVQKQYSSMAWVEL